MNFPGMGQDGPRGVIFPLWPLRPSGSGGRPVDREGKLVKARDAILAAIRSALPQPWDGGDPTDGRVRDYRRNGILDPPGLLDLLESRLKDYKASVTRCLVPELPFVVSQRLAQLGGGVVVVPQGLPHAWVQEVPDGHPFIRRDRDPKLLETNELAAARGTVSGCSLAIAETGTLVLSGSAREGRRAITLLPDHHLCVVFSHQVVETVPEGIEEISAMVVQDQAPITLISGPSATSDIELIRVEGVHGPRELDVILVEDSQGDYQ